MSVDEWLRENQRRAHESGTPPNPGRFYAEGNYHPPPSQAMANWALGLALAFCIPAAFLVAGGLAIAVLVRSRDGRNHGKGKAIAALVISSLLLFANIAYAVVVFFTGIDETERDAEGRVVDGGSVTLDRLQVGDCFSEPNLEDLPDDGSGGVSSEFADVVPCQEPHQAEVFHEIVVDGDDFPGDEAIERRTAECLPAFKTYVGVAYARSQLDAVFYFPTRSTWRFGDREITCSLIDPDLEDLSGSMQGSRR